MTRNIPELAPILARIESIVYEQDRRVEGGEPVTATDAPALALASMTEDELYEALHETEEAACDLIDTTGMNPGQCTRARAHVHSALVDYADALTESARVVNPRDKTRATADLARTIEDVRILIRYPRAADLMQAVDKLEAAAERHRNSHDADAHMDTLYEMHEAMRTIWRFGPDGAERLRHELVILTVDCQDVRHGRHLDALTELAADLDNAREALAAAYVASLGHVVTVAGSV